MGEWTTAELRGQGLSKDAIRRKVREGKLFRVHRGIYTDEWTPWAAVSYTHLTLPTNREV